MREKVRPARPGVGVSAKKFAPRTKNGPKMAVYGVPGELFRERAAEGPVLGELCRGRPKRRMQGKLYLAISHTRTLLGELCLGSSGNRLAGTMTVTKWA